MDPQNDQAAVARVDIPGSSGVVLFVVASTFLGFFVVVAISNLVDYESVPLYAIILSVLWLLIVGSVFTANIRERGGLRPSIMILLAELSAHQFLEIIPQHGDDLMVRFGFTLLGRDFSHLQIDGAKLASVVWSSGQATSLAGHDMNDWQVGVWYDCKGSKRWFSASDYREEAGYVVGPEGPRHEAAALGASLVDFFRSAGIELHPTKDEREFTTRRQG